MISCDNTQEEHIRAPKRAKVDSPVISRCTGDCTKPFNYDGLRHNSISLTPPSKGKEEDSTADDEHNHITAEDVSPVATAASSKSPSHEQHEDKEERENDDDGKGMLEVLRVAHPARPSATVQRTSTRLSGSNTASSATATTTAISCVPLPVSTNGAITTLRSLSQLTFLVSSANTTSAKERTHPDLRLKPGESVMLLLFFDEASLRPLINAATSELSQMRVFTLNLSKLPPQDYELSSGKRLGIGSVVLHSTAALGATTAADGLRNSATEQVVGAAHSNASQVTQNATGSTKSEDEDEEEELVPAVHPMAVSTAAAEASTAAERERAPRSSGVGAGGAATLDEATSVSSLSNDLHHASDVVREKLRQMLSIDAVLNPHSLSGGGSSKREPLLFPAMIVWRAAGAPREEYPPAPPQTYSSQPSPTPAELFCDRMSTQGGPLVVKEATSIDQVHSLTLFRPVYTMENLFRTLVRLVAPSFATKAPGAKSRTVLYCGASWCPPCMRFVHEMPHFIREDLPSSVVCTVKADMDLAKPIYDFFKVQIIPTFLVLDNEVLMRCYDNLQQRGVAEAGSTGVATSQSDYLHSIQNAFSKAELARLQNSNRQLVSTFVSKHSQKLSFDEDF
ncbi:hypothetical protein ABB37_00211 [Leptomonas pyrrhocoris]|uniref:Thioredoxin domain-containing protein n=1 Tax=Leptomonas pyrrhocoris TaxID=157538 RepID=A0A0M9GA24_LEPPY|nr:hypothetical protein ABB37_00211 [Leptomonas pyrrhocoris]KPA85897.1 hypothetical protein ABB37_00211 [Leptomonas pyrrhocoris]|eukprot:XP_015664336.1 hypothetical protein ABB37_00211 [Leptomonas pyrrhocoris]